MTKLTTIPKYPTIKELTAVQTPTIPVIDSKSSFKLIITDNLEAKIRKSCKLFPSLEWSGVLFYKPKGTFSDKNLELIASDFIPMDIGTSGYTEFEEDPDIIGYMVENNLLDYQMGLIHSHNNMATFFSGTDTATLKKEGEERVHFLSLIVNNAGTYTAAITQLVTENSINKTICKYKSFDDEEIKDVETVKDESTYLVKHTLQIEVDNNIPKDDPIYIRYEEIKAKKAKAEAEEAEKRKLAAQKNQQLAIQNRGKFSGYSGYKGYPYNQNKTTYKPTKNKINSIPKQRGLFDDAPIKATYNQQYLQDILGQDMVLNLIDVEPLVQQALTGSILAGSNSPKVFKEWVNTKMVEMYDNRFGNDKEGYDNFNRWVDYYIEQLIVGSEIEDLIAMDYEEADETLARDMMIVMSKYKSNIYIDAIVNKLFTYIKNY